MRTARRPSAALADADNFRSRSVSTGRLRTSGFSSTTKDGFAPRPADHRLFRSSFTALDNYIPRRQIDLDRVPSPRLAVDLDVTARLLDTAVTWLSPRPCLPRLLVVKTDRTPLRLHLRATCGAGVRSPISGHSVRPRYRHCAAIALVDEGGAAGLRSSKLPCRPFRP